MMKAARGKYFKRKDNGITIPSKKFDHIIYVPGEDLNIERNLEKLLRKAWNDIAKYPTMKQLADAVLVGERTLYTYAKKYHWPNRGAVVVDMFKPKANGKETGT